MSLKVQDVQDVQDVKGNECNIKSVDLLASMIARQYS